jgi:aromatic ring-cleaving dioxygenase
MFCSYHFCGALAREGNHKKIGAKIKTMYGTSFRESIFRIGWKSNFMLKVKGV